MHSCSSRLKMVCQLLGWAAIVFLVVWLAVPQYSTLCNRQFNVVGPSIKEIPISSEKRETNEQKALLREKAYKYNLLDGTDDWLEKLAEDHTECTLEYMNANKLAQDHPCVIDMIRRRYLHKPSPPHVPYFLPIIGPDPNKDPSRGQTGPILRLLKNQTGGFYVECGALDGEFTSNTLYMERKLNWNGVLIEANPSTYNELLKRHRKAWTLPICLSLEPYPTEVSFLETKAHEAVYAHIDEEAPIPEEKLWDKSGVQRVTVQCFPFYSVLLAINQTQIDFFSLDVEGHEFRVLKTIPWHKVDIKTLTVEVDHIAEGEEAVISYMEENGFITHARVHFPFSRDTIFMKDTINNLSSL